MSERQLVVGVATDAARSEHVHPRQAALRALQDIQRLLTQARALIVAMDPPVPDVDELVHAALITAESELRLQPARESFAAASAESERLLAPRSDSAP
jgi:DNA primase